MIDSTPERLLLIYRKDGATMVRQFRRSMRWIGVITSLSMPLMTMACGQSVHSGRNESLGLRSLGPVDLDVNMKISEFAVRATVTEKLPAVFSSDLVPDRVAGDNSGKYDNVYDRSVPVVLTVNHVYFGEEMSIGRRMVTPVDESRNARARIEAVDPLEGVDPFEGISYYVAIGNYEVGDQAIILGSLLWDGQLNLRTFQQCQDLVDAGLADVVFNIRLWYPLRDDVVHVARGIRPLPPTDEWEQSVGEFEETFFDSMIRHGKVTDPSR